MSALFLKAITLIYPGAIEKGDGESFKRPHDYGWYTDGETNGFFWRNCVGDRFYFATAQEAAEDLARDLGMDEGEAHLIIRQHAQRASKAKRKDHENA